MQNRIMQLVRQICNTKSEDCRSLNKAKLAREILNLADIPQDAEIQEIPLDWDNQVVILFLMPDDVNYYSLFAGIGNDGKFYIELSVTGILNGDREDRFDFISEEIPLDINHFKNPKISKSEITKEVNERIQEEIDDLKQTNDLLTAWLHSGI